MVEQKLPLLETQTDLNRSDRVQIKPEEEGQPGDGLFGSFGPIDMEAQKERKSSIKRSSRHSHKSSDRQSILLDKEKREALGMEEMKLCEVCYEEYPISQFYALSCGHMFCEQCIKDDMAYKIADGKTSKFPCL